MTQVLMDYEFALLMFHKKIGKFTLCIKLLIQIKPQLTATCFSVLFTEGDRGLKSSNGICIS